MGVEFKEGMLKRHRLGKGIHSRRMTLVGVAEDSCKGACSIGIEQGGNHGAGLLSMPSAWRSGGGPKRDPAMFGHASNHQTSFGDSERTLHLGARGALKVSISSRLRCGLYTM